MFFFDGKKAYLSNDTVSIDLFVSLAIKTNELLIHINIFFFLFTEILWKILISINIKISRLKKI